MSAAIQVKGPALLAFNGNFVGTAEIRPHILFRRQYMPVFNDIGGLIPLDWQYMGQDALLQIDLNRFDPDQIDAMRALATPLGVDNFDSIGTLMIQEEVAAEVGLKFLRDGTGLTFQAAWLLGPDRDELGTRHEIQRLIFYCGRTLNIDSQSMTLFTLEVPNVSIS